MALVVERLDDNPERALPYVRAMVAADPLSESAHARLVNLLAALGRRKDAEDHYQYARSMLRRELAAPLLGELSPPAPRRGQPWSSTQTGSPALGPRLPLAKVAGLVGRFDERQMVTASIGALLQGKPPAAMLFLGEPGIGKSRLLQMVAEETKRKGAKVIGARCFEAEAVRPYGSWTDALGSLIADVVDPASQRLGSRFGADGDLSADDGGGRTRLLAAVTDLIRAETVRCPIVLIFDDLQWIDEGSSSLLHYVLRATRSEGRVLFIGAARADEIEDNPWCKRTLSAIAHDDALQRVQLSPLGAKEAAEFFAADAGEDEVATAVRQSGGNPLFLVELARAGRPQAVGRDIEAIIADRIARLDAPERDLIVFASATTRDIKPELLGIAMDLPEPQLIERINRLERRGLLRPAADGRFDFAHDLIRQTTYRGLSQPHRRLIHRQIARALGSAAQRDQTLAGELAYHAGAASDHMLAVEASIAAGEHCLRLFAKAAAIDAANHGLGHLAQLGSSADRAHSHISLLRVKVFAGQRPGLRPQPELFAEIRRAVETAELMGLRDDAVLGWHMISWWTQHSNDTLAAQEAILRAEEISRRTDELMRCRQLANTGRCLLEVEGDVRH